MQSDERTRLEILDQPDSLRNTVAREYSKVQEIARKIVDRKCLRIFLVGMGSSYSAALMASTSVLNMSEDMAVSTISAKKFTSCFAN